MKALALHECRVSASPWPAITAKPGEVHDGRPLDGPSRRWRMLYLDRRCDVRAGEDQLFQPTAFGGG
jgi:hypothetical protein